MNSAARLGGFLLSGVCVYDSDDMYTKKSSPNLVFNFRVKFYCPAFKLPGPGAGARASHGASSESVSAPAAPT
jgi:hypothetical protein